VRIAVAKAMLLLGCLPLAACVDDDFADGQFLCSPSGGADECPPEMSCDQEGRCRRSADPACKPRACADLAPLCGKRDDGCGGTIDCSDECWPPQSCGGGGVVGECGCVPKQELEHTAGAFWNDATLGSVSWSNPELARDDDGAFATAELGDAAISNYLKAADFRFNLASTAIVEGVEIIVDRSASSEAALADHALRVALEGQLLPKIGQSPEAWPSTEAAARYGGAGDLWDADAEIPPAVVNKANFGVALAVAATGGAATARVDSIRVRLFVANPSCK
jgi:hypothetical protein